ncbi:hypothetical protein [Natrarchaeobius oligotrophus]|uniref:hypothetical protein n=1 Tax=Natrarchaeobius oligotrophus TaxID=3455743 RepID=UPI001404A4DC|nr:hypothetical protein [Natrarchaeobius chitinivorans]
MPTALSRKMRALFVRDQPANKSARGHRRRNEALLETVPEGDGPERNQYPVA